MRVESNHIFIAYQDHIGMIALFEFDCCSYLYELQSWQPDNRYATPVPKTEAAAALLKSLL